MNIALLFNDTNRFWTVGSYIIKELSKQNDINIVSHCRIPEDSGILEEQCGLNADLVLVIDDGGTHFKLHHHKGKFPKHTKTSIWLSDLHREDWAAWRLQMIREFKYDHIFYAQKNFKEMVLKQGYSEDECSWLPHAVDPDIFKPMPYITKQYDIGYVGYKNDKREKAEKILNEYMKFKQYASVWAWTACRSLNELKIGFNISVEDDINMRVFESMCCGIPLLTNKIKNNGFEDLFGDNEEFCLTYDNDLEMKEKAVRLLANPELRNILGNKGRNHVLVNHTYRNRINTILGTFKFKLLENMPVNNSIVIEGICK